MEELYEESVGKKAVTLLLLLTIIVPGCFVRYYDVYGDNKQNLDNANNKKVIFRVNMIKHRRSWTNSSHRVTI